MYHTKSNPSESEMSFLNNCLSVISCIISDPEASSAVNEKLHEYSEFIIARLGVPCRDYGVSVISIVLSGSSNTISTLSGALGKIPGVKTKSVQVRLDERSPSNGK